MFKADQNVQNQRINRVSVLLLAVVLVSCILSGCGSTAQNGGGAQDAGPGFFEDSGIEQFALSSEDLHDGVWDSVITKTDKGENKSPQLSWKPVDGAQSYVVYMVDTSAGNWIHWKSDYITGTELVRGSAAKEEYVGPYPPNGTHTYEVYVIALKKPVEKIKGLFDNADGDIAEKMLSLETAEDGSEGNIAGFGHIVGTYTKGE